MTKEKCPIKNCDGWETTSKLPNLLNHIKGHAKTELFKKQFFSKTKTPHFDYIMSNHILYKKIENIILIKD